MRQAVLRDRVLERPRDVRLPDEIVERLRSVFARENLITHAPIYAARGGAKIENRLFRFI